MTSASFRLLAGLLALALFAVACGSGSADDETAGGADEAEDAAQPTGDAAEPATETEPEPTPEPSSASDDATAEPDVEPTATPEPTAEPEPEPEATATPQPTLSTTVEQVRFDDDFATSVQPIIAEKCANCHGADGPGAAHWQITTAQDLVDTHMLISAVVTSNYMPPWPASDASLPFKDNRDLTDDQVQAIVDWSAAGAPLDIDPTTPIVSSDPVIGLSDPDVVIVPDQPYAGNPGTVDDYRCQIYDPQLPDGGWITGYEFIPDQTAVVHHAIGYVIEADRAERAAERDGEDGRPGWECYGSSGLGGDDLFLGWAPGQDATLMPEGAGLYLPPGSFLVVQIHYHYEAEAPEDASALALTIADTTERGALDDIEVATLVAPVEIPCAEWESGPLCDRDAALADALDRFGDDGVQAERFNALCGVTPEDFAQFDQGTAESSCYIPTVFVGAFGEVISVLGHMHEIGSWFRMTVNPGGPDETVLLDIPTWDFDWQYNYVPEEPFFLGADDFVLIECGWDRSLRDPSLPPAYILWADGTNDEMCFATITVRR